MIAQHFFATLSRLEVWNVEAESFRAPANVRL